MPLDDCVSARSRYRIRRRPLEYERADLGKIARGMDRKPVLRGSKTFIINGQHAMPVAGLLIDSRRRVLEAFRLALCNSDSTAGSRDRVVGYGAWMFGQAA